MITARALWGTEPGQAGLSNITNLTLTLVQKDQDLPLGSPVPPSTVDLFGRGHKNTQNNPIFWNLSGPKSAGAADVTHG